MDKIIFLKRNTSLLMITYIYSQGSFISSQRKESNHFGNMLLKANQLVILAFVCLVCRKHQILISSRKAFENFHVNITIFTYSYLKGIKK